MVTINTESALTPRSLRDTRRMNMFVSVAAAVAGLLFGLDIGVIAGALPFITDHFVLTSAGYAAYEYVCFGSCCGRRIVIWS